LERTDLQSNQKLKRASFGIWGWAFGYFACYVPYSALTKALSDGRMPGALRKVGGFELLPSTTMVSLVGMIVFMVVTGWWRHASRARVFGLSIPSPTRWTFLSGLCTAAIIATTTLAYTFSGVSIVFMMLLMRGGVLVIAPLVDAGSGRTVRPAAWLALGLSVASLLVALLGSGARANMTMIALIDVIVYLAGYFVRLRFMSKLAKSNDPKATLRYFVEEQIVATPAIVLTLAVAALIGYGDVSMELRRGFTGLPGTGAWIGAILVGMLSQGTGVFGALVLLDGRENSFCVPVNRASSVLAGIGATAALAIFAGGKTPPASEIAGAGLVMGAIAVLAVSSAREKKK
jgi:hypothetical protein